MKYSIIVLLGVMMLAAPMFSYGQKKNAKDQFTIQVDGLGCPFCAYGLEKKFKEFKGIKNVKIEMETGIFTFTYPADKAISIEQVENKVKDAGYTAVTTKIERADGTIEENSNEVVMREDAIMAQTEFFVSGNCGMCKSRIEMAAKSVQGVADAEWDKESKMLLLDYDSNYISPEDVMRAIAKSGHDTKTAKADEETYDKLPGCCQYERL